MTTVANGFCTSAPVPVARAIGTKPSEATSAVMITGKLLSDHGIKRAIKRPDRKRRRRPFAVRCP